MPQQGQHTYRDKLHKAERTQLNAHGQLHMRTNDQSIRQIESKQIKQ